MTIQSLKKITLDTFRNAWGIAGKGRFTEIIVDSIQNYYGQAIKSNIANLKATQSAVWAIYYQINY